MLIEEFPNLMAHLPALYPEIIVALTAFVVMLVDMFISDKRFAGGVGLLGLIGAAAATFAMFSRSPAPAFQDMAVSDGYSLVLNLIFITTAALSILLSLSYLEGQDMQRGEYYALILFSTVGMMMMGAATDLIIIFMGLEIMSIALYILAAFNRNRLSSGEAGMKYFVLGAFASAFFLYGAALLYGATGTTNLLAMGDWLAGQGNLNDPLALVGLGLLLVGFGFKVAAVPFQWWTPDVYQGAPTSVTAFMSVGAKAAGFASLVRVLMLSFGTAYLVDWQQALAVLAVITMTGGNIAALAQKDVKRMLAYSSIAHAGYILVGVVPGTMAGVNAILFYLMSYTFMNIGAFAVIAVIERRDQMTSSLSDYAGLAGRKPWLALVMALFMFSLTGIPPFVGFWGKLYVFQAAVQQGWNWLAIAGVLNSAISAFYYLGVVVQIYMRTPAEAEREAPPVHLGLPAMVTLTIAAVLTILFGLWPTPLVYLTALGVFG